MADIITMPKLGFDMAEGTLVEWTKKVGDEVKQGDVLAVIETDKANVEVTSFKSGVLRQHLVEAGTVVPVGQPIAVIGTADEKIDGQAPPAAAEKPKEEQSAPAPSQPAPAPQPAPPPQAQAQASAPQPAGPALASPVARRMADELGISLRDVKGTGPDGRIVKRDIEEYQKQRQAQPATQVAPQSAPAPAYQPSGVEYQAAPLSQARQAIGRRMAESKQQVPHFYVTVEVDMAAAMALRQQLNALVPENEKISVNDLLIKAVAAALRQFPNVNASFAGQEIHMNNQINIGIAVAREAGLVTAVVRDCDKKSISQIAREAREVVGRARENRVRPEDMTGSTFTISNLGMFGEVENFIAIINPPEAAILAVGSVRQVPVVNAQNQLAVGTRMKATISADHRVTDGAEAARFMQAFKAALEEPMRLLM